MIFHWSVGSAQMKLAFWGHVGKAELMSSLCCICKEKGGIQSKNPQKPQPNTELTPAEGRAWLQCLENEAGMNLTRGTGRWAALLSQNLVWQPSGAIPALQGAGQAHTNSPPTWPSWLSERLNWAANGELFKLVWLLELTSCRRLIVQLQVVPQNCSFCLILNQNWKIHLALSTGVMKSGKTTLPAPFFGKTQASPPVLSLLSLLGWRLLLQHEELCKGIL